MSPFQIEWGGADTSTVFISPLIIWTSYAIPVPFLIALPSNLTLLRTECWTILILGSVPSIRPLFVYLYRRSTSQIDRTGTSRYGTGTYVRDDIALKSRQYSNKASAETNVELVAGKGSDSTEQIIRQVA